MVTVVFPELVPPALMVPTDRPAVNSTSPPSSVVSVERENLVVDAPASPPPLFVMVSVIVMFLPAPDVEADKVNADTLRSGPISIEPLDFVLLVSYFSAT